MKIRFSMVYRTAVVVLGIVIAHSAGAMILTDVAVEGWVSKLLADDVIVYNEGHLTQIPKKYFAKPQAIHVGEKVSTRMAFQESLKLKHPKIPRARVPASK